MRGAPRGCATTQLLSPVLAGTRAGCCLVARVAPGGSSLSMELGLLSEVLGGAGIAPLSVPNGLGVLSGRVGALRSGLAGGESLEDGLGAGVGGGAKRAAARLR